MTLINSALSNNLPDSHLLTPHFSAMIHTIWFHTNLFSIEIGATIDKRQTGVIK